MSTHHCTEGPFGCRICHADRYKLDNVVSGPSGKMESPLPISLPKESDTDYTYYTDSEGCGYIFKREPGGGSRIFAEARGVGDYNIEFNLKLMLELLNGHERAVRDAYSRLQVVQTTCDGGGSCGDAGVRGSNCGCQGGHTGEGQGKGSPVLP